MSQKLITLLFKWLFLLAIFIGSSIFLIAVGVHSGLKNDSISIRLTPLINKLFRLENTPTEKLVTQKFFGNDFTLNVTPVQPHVKTEKTAGIFIDSGIKIYEQSDIQKIWDQEHLYDFYKDVIPAVDANGGSYGGLRKIFDFENRRILLLTLKEKKGACFFASLFNLSKKKEFFRSPCIPDPKQVDFNAIGGGNVNYKGDLLFALGAPSVYGEHTPLLAQNLNSPYGKILLFNKLSIDDPKDIRSFNVFSSGHRNIQGLINLDGHIYAVEHGPKGGDEINLIVKGKNYGWPLYSLGSTYQGHPYKSIGNLHEYELPIFSFIPSPAISDVIECPVNLTSRYAPLKCIMVSSLKGSSVFIVLIEQSIPRVISTERIEIGMRTRQFIKGNSDKFYISTDGFGVFQIEITDVATPNAI